MKFKFQFLHGGWLKVIAMLFMVLDHVTYYFLADYSCYYYLRGLGRIAFPIFAFFIVEGMRYTKHPIRYLLQLLSIGILMDIGTFIAFKFVVGTNDPYLLYPGNTLTTFFVGGLTIFLLEKPKKFFKLFAIIPFAVGILSAFSFFPIRLEYHAYGYLTIMFFYAGYKIAQLLSIHICKYGLDLEEYRKTSNYTLLYVLIGCILNGIFWGICGIFHEPLSIFLTANDLDFVLQTYSVLSFIFLICYNGRRGWNSQVFKWTCYLFFPLHFIIIYLIGFLFGIA